MATTVDAMRALATSLGSKSPKVSRQEIARQLFEAAAFLEQQIALVRNAKEDAARDFWEDAFNAALGAYMSDPSLDTDDETTRRMIGNCREVAGRALRVWRQEPWKESAPGAEQKKQQPKSGQPAAQPPAGDAQAVQAPKTDAAAAPAGQPQTEDQIHW